MAEPSQDCRLLGLPGEIRTMIYRFVLIDEDHSCEIRPRPLSSQRVKPNYCWLALPFTSRQIYAEAVEIVYSETAFCFTTRNNSKEQLELLQWFLNAIGPANAQCITKIAVYGPQLWCLTKEDWKKLYKEKNTGEEEKKRGERGNEDRRVEHHPRETEDGDDLSSKESYDLGRHYDPEKWVEISEDGLEFLRLLRQHCPSIKLIGMKFHPPTPNEQGPGPHHPHYPECHNVVRDYNRAKRRVMRELMKLPSLREIIKMEFGASNDPMKADKWHLEILKRPAEGWPETALIHLPGELLVDPRSPRGPPRSVH